jgi:hypothetical protein
VVRFSPVECAIADTTNSSIRDEIIAIAAAGSGRRSQPRLGRKGIQSNNGRVSVCRRNDCDHFFLHIHTTSLVLAAFHRKLGNVFPKDGLYFRASSSVTTGSHHAPAKYQFKVYTAGQKRRVTPQIKRQMRRRATIEPVIGHLKDDHRMGRNYLATAPAMRSTPCWPPPPATTSAACSGG